MFVRIAPVENRCGKPEHSAVIVLSSEPQSGMRWFSAVLLMVVLFAIDRAYMDGQNAAAIMSLVRWVGMHITGWVDDLLRPLRR